MALEIAFGQGLGQLGVSAEDTIISYRSHVDLSEYSLEAFTNALHELLVGLADSDAVFALAPDGSQFFYVLVVRPPTLSLELPKQCVFTVTRRYDLAPREQLRAAAAELAVQLADLGNPAWVDPSQPRVSARAQR